MTRHEFLFEGGMALAGLSASTSGCVGLLAGRRPVVRFGCVSDTHFGDIPSWGGKFFRHSEEMMRTAVERFQRSDVDFIIELGDLIDSGEGDKSRTRASLTRIESVFRSCACPSYHVVGNHDLSALQPDEFFGLVGMTGGWYSFEKGGIRFIVLDGCHTREGRHYAPGNFVWTEAQIPDVQLQWLQDTLTGSRSPAVVFCHHPLVGADAKHRLRNAEEVVKVLEESGKVKSVFSGHYHSGGYAKKDDCIYRIVLAQVNKWAIGAIVSVYEDGSAQLEYLDA